MERRIPPSPRRRELARAAGVILDSPTWTAAFTFGVGAAVVAGLAGPASTQIATRARELFAAAGQPGALTRALAVDVGAEVTGALAIVAPLTIATAIAAVAAHAALARGLWVPRRRRPGAPCPPTGLGARTLDGFLATTRAAVLLAIALDFAFDHLVDIADLAATGPDGSARGVGGLAARAVIRLASAALILAAVDAVIRQRRLAHALRMTDREARDDRRSSTADPEIRRHQHRRIDDDPRSLLAPAELVVTGASAAVALRRRSDRDVVDVILSSGDLRRHAVVNAARRAGIPIVVDDDLSALPLGPVPPILRERAAALLAAFTR